MNNNDEDTFSYKHMSQIKKMAHTQWLYETFNFLMHNPTQFHLMDNINMSWQYHNMFSLYIKFYYDILNLCKNEYIIANNFWLINNIKIQRVVYIACLRHNTKVTNEDYAFTILHNMLHKKSTIDDQSFIEIVNDLMTDIMILQKYIHPVTIKRYRPINTFDNLVISIVCNALDEEIEYDTPIYLI
jgi:hypothetical protein